MKIILKSSIVIILWFVQIVQCFAQKYENYTGFTVPTAPVLPADETHPSLYFSEEKIEELKSRKTNENYTGLWSEIAGDANRFLSTHPSTTHENERPRMAKTMAFWWLMTGSEAAREKGIETLLIAYDNAPQTEDKRFDEIYRATWLQNYCAAYDWLFDQFTVEQDSIIRSKIAIETQWLRENLTEGLRLAPRPHNHRSKPAWAIATAALTLSSHENAADWLEYALEQMNTVTKYMFSADGIYREGGHYWMYSAVNFIPFLWHYYNVADVNLFPHYQPAFDWPVRIRMGQGWIPNLEDGYLKPAPAHLVASAYLQQETPLHSTASLGQIYQWHFQNTTVFDNNYTGATNDVTWEIDTFILYDSAIEGIAPDGPSTQKLDGGQIVFRNNWQGGDGHRYLLFQGVAESDNHNHPDHLSFYFEANGCYLIADAGYGPGGWTDDRRNSWYIRTKAHNIMTANYFPVRDVVSDSTPPTNYFFDSPFFDFAEKQAEFVNPGGIYQERAIAFVGEKYWVVLDHLHGGDASTVYHQYLHGRGDFTQNDHHITWEMGKDRYGPAQKIDVFLFPQQANLTNETGYLSLFKDERTAQYTILEQSGPDAVFMQILIPNNPGTEPPVITDLSADDFIAATATEADTVDFYFIQKARETVTSADLTTDAAFAWLRTIESTPQQAFFKEATQMEIAGFMTISADKPATFAVDFHSMDRLSLFMDPPEQSLSLQFEWQTSAPTITSVFINNESINFTQTQNGQVEVKITGQATGVLDFKEYADESINWGALQTSPNPFSDNTEIYYQIKEDGFYSLQIFDMRGRRIIKLADGFHQSKMHHVKWNGTSEAGTRVATGLYFAVLQNKATGDMQVHKIVNVR